MGALAMSEPGKLIQPWDLVLGTEHSGLRRFKHETNIQFQALAVTLSR